MLLMDLIRILNFQRERDRERAAARAGGKGKNGDDGLTPEQRRERDGKALQEKAAKKAAQAADFMFEIGLFRPEALTLV
ncbi:unnamed protein product [Arabidopsis thaliana]|uniref:(thale cress) hypothetical protein n=1 Tax=Arabidopsis thaliana TaxID=3702 RepID=A0A7G2EZC0_ARATH|nr:unnamed protein product [Arabidopsis thaliana]